MKKIYLDHAATTPVKPEFLDLFCNISTQSYYNPSSSHSGGHEAAVLVKDSAFKLSQITGCRPEDIYFTSGGTESNNIILTSLLTSSRRGKILVSSIEHASITEPAKYLSTCGFQLEKIPVNKIGLIDIEGFSRMLTPDIFLVCIMMVNNETGVIQPIKELSETIRLFEKTNNCKIHFHTDAVQTLGKVPFRFDELKVDSASFSAHKLAAPKGCGALYLNKKINTIYQGGGQQKGMRPGTENTAGIAAFAAAAVDSIKNMTENSKNALLLKTKIINTIHEIPNTILFSQLHDDFSPYIINFSIPPIPSEVLVRIMDDKGFMISSGSACTSNLKNRKDSILKSMGYYERTAFSAIRISTGFSTTEDEVDQFCNVLKETVMDLQKTFK